MAADALGLLERAAGHLESWPYAQWRFGESIGVEGLLAAGGRHAAIARSLLVGWARDMPRPADDPAAHLVPGVPLLLAGTDDDDRALLMARAAELAVRLSSLPRGHHGAFLHRPDLEPWTHHVWVDCMQLDGPFITLLARLTGDTVLAELGADMALAHARVLQDEASGLFSHGFDDRDGAPNRIHWARGQGWALLGLVGTLANLGPDMRGRGELQERARMLLRALGRTTSDGRWRAVADAPQMAVEPSTSAFVALGVLRAEAIGLADEAARELGRAARAAALAWLRDDGSYPVSSATPVSSSLADYADRPLGVFPWGQGPVLLMELEAVGPTGGLRG